MSKSVQSIHRFLDGHRGYLWRKSQLNGAWKNRYFILEKKKMRCYEDDSCLKLVSEMTIFNDTELFDLPGSSDNRSHLIYFTASADDVYYLSADHHIDKAHWLEAITDAKHSGFKLVDQPRLGIEPFFPSVDLCVTFGDNSIFASNDNKLQPHVVESAPSIIMRFGNPTSIYSLLMIDLDSVRANSEERTEYLMWGIVNIEGTDVSSGLELAPYESPSPEYGSGMHRYMLLLFDQSSDFTPDQFDLLDDIFSRRDQFKHLDWMSQFHLKSPAGINGFYAGWEEYCDVLHDRMGYTPAVVYFSPKMEAEAETARTETARVDLFRDLVLGDIFPADEVVPDSAPQHGTIAMTIEYDNDYVVEDGQTIPASQVKTEPAVAFYPHPIGVDALGNPECGLYTLVLVDPDAPSRISHDLREVINWVVVNISDADVAKGDVALPYTGPAPSYASGLHRNVFCLYKQKRAFSPEEVEQTKSHFASRMGITSFDWVRAQASTLYKVPVGVEAFLSEWDLSVDDAHAAMAYMPPEQYRSPSQRRSTMLAGAGTPRPGFSATTPRTADPDVIGSRLRKIHEAEALFNTKVIETSRVNTELAGANSGANSPKGDHEEMFGVDMDEEEPVEAKTAAKKVVQRNPVTFSGTSKTFSPRDTANQPLSLSLSEDNSTAASAAALRDSSKEEKNDVIISSRDTTTSNSISVAKRAEHHTDQTQKANILNKARRETSDGHVSEEVMESQHEQHHEQRTERSEKSEHSESRQESRSTSATSSPRAYIQSGQQALEMSSELHHSREMHESSSRNQQAQLKLMQFEAQQRQEEDAQQQEQLRREQKSELKRQQQELLERQAQEQQRQQQMQQEQQERALQEQQQRPSSSRRQREQEEREYQERAAWELQQQQQRSGGSSRRQREEQEQEQIPRQSSRRSAPEEHKDGSSPPKGGRTKDFFSALPDSEYSDTDTGSVISGVPQSDHYQQEHLQQQQKKQPGSVPTSSTMRSQGHAAVDMEEQSVASDTSSQQPSVARSVDLRQQAAAKRAEGGGSAGRYKQLLEGLATVKSTTQLCDLFGVSTSSIFAGEKMKKKMNNDFMFKDSYIWIIPRTRTLHWSKTKGDAGDSKYLLLDTVTGVDPTAPPKGEFKGIVKRVRVSGPNLLITIESGDFLELKLAADGAPPAQKRANDWAVVIKAFTQG